MGRHYKYRAINCFDWQHLTDGVRLVQCGPRKEKFITMMKWKKFVCKLDKLWKFIKLLTGLEELVLISLRSWWIKAECLEIDGDVEKGTNTENRTGKVCHLQTVKKADRPSEKKRDLQCALWQRYQVKWMLNLENQQVNTLKENTVVWGEPGWTQVFKKYSSNT